MDTILMRIRILALLFCLLLASSACFGAVAHVKSAGANTSVSCAGATFSYTANAANNLVLFAVGCADTNTLSNASMTATGWTITKLDGPVGTSANWQASFWAVAPNTSAATFTVVWTGNSGSGVFTYDAVDEFSGQDGVSPIDNHTNAKGSGNCTLSLTPVVSNTMLWGGCQDSATQGAGFTLGGNDGSGDVNEWKLLSGGAGAGQTINFTGSGTWEEVAVSIKPAGGAVACTNRILLMGAGCT